MLNGFPWKNNIEPDFINEEGFSWYIDKGLTDWATEKRPGSKAIKAVVYLIAKNEKPVTYAIIQNNELVYEHTGMESIACYIDILRMLEGSK